MELSKRKQKILESVVEQYIKTGEPIGSKALLDVLDFSVSSATVRNEMSELSALGYLEQPHTSAGRIPSHKGYRYYVDNLIGSADLDEKIKQQIDASVSGTHANPEKILAKASEALAHLTDCAAVSTTPKEEEATIKRIEIVPIGTKTAMIVMLTSTGILKNRVCRSDCELTPDILETFYNIAKISFIGKRIYDVETVMLQTLVASIGTNALMMIPLLSVVAELAQEAVQTQLLMDGQSNLLHHRDYGDNAYELMEFLRRGEPMGQLLSSFEGNVIIGNENAYRQLKNSSVIMASYSIQGSKAGAIGIVGPTRLDYKNLIPSVQYLTSLVGEILEQILNDE